jgi:hypothetical protein
VQGAVDTVSNPNITVLGVAVDTTPIFQFEDVNDIGIPRATFFGSVQRGTLVKIKGRLSGNAVVWEEAEFED